MLPPYSPDMNPIESVFSEVKQYLQANDLFHTSLSMNTILLMAFNSVKKIVYHTLNMQVTLS